MTDTFDIDGFDDPPLPPEYLYKYLSPERVHDVLKDGTVRFTPLVNTNDSFEVRKTFQRFFGPKTTSALLEIVRQGMTEDAILQLIHAELANEGHEPVSDQQALRIANERCGGDFAKLFPIFAQAWTMSQTIITDDQYAAWKAVEAQGRKYACFSLSERWDIDPMWAHYAGNHTGFVITFRAENEWFRRVVGSQKTHLQKITYFDGQLGELFDNLRNALISKTSDWDHEREWRVYASVDEADKTVGPAEDPIHLMHFPPEAVANVIVGWKASADYQNQIRSILAKKYPHAGLFRAEPDRTTTTCRLVPI